MLQFVNNIEELYPGRFFSNLDAGTKTHMFVGKKITDTRICFHNRIKHIEGMHSILLFWVFYKKIYEIVDGMIFFVAHMQKACTLEKKRAH